MEEKKKRFRRTNAQVESAIKNAMEKLVQEYGFPKITVNMLIAEAGI